MATPENQQTWVPYESTRDCSLGKCSIYCPEWCSVYFIPPPPSIFADDNSSNSPTLSPLVIALIGILVSAFLLISYYTIISRYCGSNSIRRRLGNSGSADGGPGQSTRLEEWQAFPSDGLDESLISRIVVCKYKKGGGFVDSPDCPVCLSEFRNDESLRLLPNCCHAFHIQCIDTWLKSHSNCPICRASIMPEKLPPPAMIHPSPTTRVEAHDSPVVISVDDRDERNKDLVAGIDNNSRGSEQETHFQNKSEPVKEESSSVVEISSAKDHDNIQQIRRPLPMDSVKLGKVSIDYVSQTNTDLNLIAAKEKGISAGTSSSRLGSEEGSENNSNNRALDSIANPVLMKRSSSNERLSLNKHGRGKNAVLPV